jgi:hypothetical protein
MKFALTCCAQNGISCLGTAAYNGHLEVIKFLCQLGNKRLMSLRDEDGVSPPGHAKSQGHSGVAAYLESVGFQSQVQVKPCAASTSQSGKTLLQYVSEMQVACQGSVFMY